MAGVGGWAQERATVTAPVMVGGRALVLTLYIAMVTRQKVGWEQDFKA